jgi:hypothetical protein
VNQNDNGSFEVSPGEVISIVVTVANAANLAAFGDPNGCSCDPAPGDSTGPISRRCTMPTTPGTWCKVVVVFGWVADPQGNYDGSQVYTVKIEGDTGAPAVDHIAPPPPASGIYRFHVSQS